jgi:hypothetical protein
MKEPQILHDMNYDFYIWYQTKDPIFSEISLKSRLPQKWVEFKYVTKYKDSIIKPINRYVEALCPPPELISIKNNTVRLRQKNHAEFFLLIQKNGLFYNLDRPWMRQYYNTKHQIKEPSDCFPGTYIFYTPWYIDDNVKIFYEKPEQETAFFVYSNISIHKKFKETDKYIEPDFIRFHFKKEGSHMDRPGFGKIPRQTPMFDIVFECDDIMLNRVKDFYEQN